MRWQGASWTIAPWQLRPMLQLPGSGRTMLEIGGPAADRYFKGLARVLDRPARNAGFAISAGGAGGVIPSRRGRELGGRKTEANLPAAPPADKPDARGGGSP